jgi:hypothetical protein
MSLESQALTYLESYGAIPALIPLLAAGPHASTFANYILPTLFNLCRINKRRQEMAALGGCVPYLQSIIKTDSHLKQFAFPIICDLAHTSDVTRAELMKVRLFVTCCLPRRFSVRTAPCVSCCVPFITDLTRAIRIPVLTFPASGQHGGAAFYIDLLKEKYWQSFALNSLAVWLASDRAYVEPLILDPDSLARLVDFFRTASQQSIRMLHKPFLDMMTKSEELCRALTNSGLYVTALVKRLGASDAIVLRSLLKMLQLLHQYHPNPRHFVLDNDLYNVVRSFAQSEGQVLVHQISNKLLVDFQSSTLT